MRVIRVKKTFNQLFLVLVVVLMALPFVTTFNEFLTRVVQNSLLYRPIAKYFVPYEIQLVRTLISFFGVETSPNTVFVIKNGINYGTYISWNCIGWQSLVILLFSLRAGLTGNFTKFSKLQVIIFGVFGTFFLNLIRISSILVILFYLGRTPAAIIHDYASVIISIFWLFFFWWFSYSYILETRGNQVIAEERSE